jgi:hypothetical protein
MRVRIFEASGAPGGRVSGGGGGGVRCIVISEGMGNLKDRNVYLPSAIRSAAKAIDGSQCYLNHPSESEEQDRPERSVRDLCGWWTNPQIGTTKDPKTGEPLTALFATLKFDMSRSGQYAKALVQTALNHSQTYPGSKDSYAGISINGGGVSEPGTMDGMQVNMVKEIQELFSADIVTKPARGGKFLQLVESQYGANRLILPRRRRKQRTFGGTGTEAAAIFHESYARELREKKGVFHG